MNTGDGKDAIAGTGNGGNSGYGGHVFNSDYGYGSNGGNGGYGGDRNIDKNSPGLGTNGKGGTYLTC
ncbi:hypothetical protein GXM_07738 [Nostoc sphaeroides CCNUC1]|uniref:Uncharacterized protein n=1 Tax=Nostoc sphaeroides CCNUC1 TaxID=2653204 RepID=A0A5P8WC78_9NOSO|nr:hypothetical protein GXM_07738 [Nostoc sphaeroides CCNUC1]